MKTAKKKAGRLSETEYLMAARTPEDYIKRSLEVSIPQGRKAKVTTLWLKFRGFALRDLQEARSRNPYWKTVKTEGSTQRAKNRFAAHDYRVGGKSVRWNDGMIRRFIELNVKDGRKISTKDFLLAKVFKTTIPSIQYMRRKYNLALRVMERRGEAYSRPRHAILMAMNEEGLKGLL